MGGLKRINPRFIWKNHFILWNLVALVFVKAIFSYSGLELTSLISGLPVFDKEEVISQTNDMRSASGLNALKESGALDVAAAQKLQDMIQGQYFAHTSPTGTSPWHWIEINQYDYTYAGENLAIGFSTAKDTVAAWANSPSHRENLLNSHYKEIGVAVAPAEIRGSDGILVVQLFGTPIPTKVAVLTASRPPQTTAKSKPSVTPKQTVSPSPIYSGLVLPQKVGLTKADETSSESPTIVATTKNSPALDQLSGTLNKAYAIYSFLILLASVVFVVFAEAKRELVFKTALNLALVAASIIIPVIHISSKALIV